MRESAENVKLRTCIARGSKPKCALPNVLIVILGEYAVLLKLLHLA